LNIENGLIGTWSCLESCNSYRAVYNAEKGYVRIPVHPDRYSGNDPDSVPEVSGHESGGMWTAFRRYPDTNPEVCGQQSGGARTAIQKYLDTCRQSMIS
jgi:hypothetical protein